MRFLNSVMQEELAPIRERRLEWQAKLPEVVKILEEGTKRRMRQRKRLWMK